MTKYWTFGDAERLDARLDKAGKIVSNTNSPRTGQIMDLLERADRQLEILQPGKDIVLIDREPRHLEEIMAKVLREMCPKHIVTQQNHHLPHYVVYDGKLTMYTNLDQNSPIAMIISRPKHPCSAAEKVARKTAYFGRVCERHDRHKLMIGDVNGFEVIVREPKDVAGAMAQVLGLPFFKLEHYERHNEANGYSAEHANLVYKNGNPFMQGLEVEVQVTDLQSHVDSKTKPEQAHHIGYGSKKLGSTHDLGERQLIIVGNGITIPDGLSVMETEEVRIVRVPNTIQPYTLVMPRQS
ncbi:hypothetical protein HZB90_00035 [archaeon]|nr:hypothetical protein [archaeon]